jgi:hypothetical protein
MIQQHNNHIKLSLTQPHQILLKSLQIPLKSIVSNKDIIIYSNDIIQLTPQNKFDYETILHITKSLSNQILFLQSHNFNISGFNLSDFYLVDNKFCIFINPNKLFNSVIYTPPPKSQITNKIKELPATLSNNDTIFILGLFINFLFSKQISTTPSTYCLNTKLYFFIKYAIKYNTLLLV